MFMHTVHKHKTIKYDVVVCVNSKYPTLVHPLYPWHYRGYVNIKQQGMEGKES